MLSPQKIVFYGCCHNYEITANNTAVVIKTPEQRQEYDGWCLLRPVRADQLEQTNWSRLGFLKEWGP